MNNLALKWHDIDVSFLKENDDVMVNLSDMAKGFPKKDLRHIMNSKEMREYIQAIKRHYEARETKLRNIILPDSQLVTDTETEGQICLSIDSQSVTNTETKTKICVSTDFQSVRVVHGEKTLSEK